MSLRYRAFMRTQVSSRTAVTGSRFVSICHRLRYWLLSVRKHLVPGTGYVAQMKGPPMPRLGQGFRRVLVKDLGMSQVRMQRCGVADETTAVIV